MIGQPVSCGLHCTLFLHFFSPRFSLRSLITSTLPGPSVSEVTTLWLYTNLFIIIFLAHQHKACRQLKIKQEMTAVVAVAVNVLRKETAFPR